jgi:hypothetical protein
MSFRVDHFVIGWSVRKPLFLETFGHGLHVRRRIGITDASPSRDRTSVLIIIVSIIFFSECFSVIKLLAWLSGCGCLHI